MGTSIEFKIRFKAAIIYMTVALAVVAMTLYLNDLHKNISFQRQEIENQQKLLSVVNNLMITVNDAQSMVGLYISTKRKEYMNNHAQFVDSISTLLDTIVLLRPDEEERLHRLDSLLHNQMENVKRLALKFAERSMVELAHVQTKEYEPSFQVDTVYVTETKRDTLITEVPRKGFFRRLGNLFSPTKDTVTMVFDQRVDSVIMNRVNISVIYEGEEIAQQAQKIYEQKIKTIEKQVIDLISSNGNIAKEVSALLMDFHKETLSAMLLNIGNSEQAIRDNYTYSTMGGVVALMFILVFIVMIIMDINKGRKARLALEAANERTRQIMESRHKLLLSVSHDMKSPLHSMMGYLALMKSDSNVRSIQNSLEHILSMLENLLGYSNLEQGDLGVNVSDFNLKTLFEEIYNMFLPLSGQKTLTCSFTADNVRISTDRVKLKQIVINLVSNAIKYTKEGTVSFGATFEKGEINIKVIDTGIGIPAEKWPVLYKPFVRIEEHSAIAEGTGLGMFVVKGLTELLGGKITLDSKVGTGTTVCITIPARYAQKEIPVGAKKIVVFDDDPVTVKMVSDMLVRLGHKVVDNINDCDLVITDMEMGSISGLDILHKVSGAVPVVVMTGRADFSAQKAIELGFDHFLPKPFTMETLREMVGEGEPDDDLMGDNREEIMTLFRNATHEHFLILKEALADNNFPQAQATCHKMFPMFAQLGYPTKEICKMNAHHNSEYEGWQEDVERIVAIKI